MLHGSRLNFKIYLLGISYNIGVGRGGRRGGGGGGGGGQGGRPPITGEEWGKIKIPSPPNNPPTFSFNFYVKQGISQMYQVEG